MSDELQQLRDELRAANKTIATLREHEAAGYALSTYAASIHWNSRQPNTRDWLDGLREAIELVQANHAHWTHPVSKLVVPESVFKVKPRG